MSYQFVGDGMQWVDDGQDEYSQMDQTMQRFGATPYTPGMDISNMASDRPYSNGTGTNVFGQPNGPKAGQLFLPKDVYNSISPQTSSPGFFDGLGGAINDMKGGLAVGIGGPLAGAGIGAALGGAGTLGSMAAPSVADEIGTLGGAAGGGGAGLGSSGVSSMFSPLNMTGTGFTGNLSDYGMGNSVLGSGSVLGQGGAGLGGEGGGLLDWASQASGAGGAAGGAASASGLPFGLSGKDFLLGGANFLLQNSLADKARSGAAGAANRADALQQPQRLPFQQAATDMVQNPDSYFKNNPFATSMANFYKNGVIPSSIAKSGNTGFDTDRLGAQFATALGGNYNQLLDTLQGFGGFNQSPGYSGLIQQQGNTAALGLQGEAFRGVGKAANSIFGDPSQPKTPTQNPVTGSYQVNA